MTPRRSWVAYAVVCAPLVLLAIVTIMTWRAEQGFRRVSDRVIHDYAAIAAWQLARRADDALHNEVMAVFDTVTVGHTHTLSGPALVPPGRLLRMRPDRTSAFLQRATLAFTWDHDSLDIAGVLDAGAREELVRRLRKIAPPSGASREPHHMLFDSLGGRQRATALMTVRIGESDRIRGAYGVVSDVDALSERFMRLIDQGGLLPPTSGMPRTLERELAVRITRQGGGVVFATPHSPGEGAATDSTGLQNGRLHVTVGLTPAMAGALLASAPRSQVPALALMLALSLGLAILGVRHERRARELEELRTRFVANVSHELRTPLAQISMFAETLALGRERTTDEGRHFAAIIHAEALRLSTLVATVLRHSRGERSAAALRTDLLSLREEAARAVDAFAPLARAADATVAVTGEHVTAAADREALRQILLNLLDNAVKHGGRGVQVQVATSLVDGERVGEARISVDDSGPGVPESWRDRIFEAFVRVDASRTTGAGIGLSVVRELVTAHGGRVWVEASPMGGARFIVALPVVTDAPVSTPARETEDRVRA